MRRLPTNLVLAAWIGFLAVAAFHLAIADMLGAIKGIDTLAELSRFDPASLLHRLDPRSFVLLSAATLMGLSLMFLNEQRTERRRLGAGLAIASLGVVALLAGTAGQGYFAVDTTGLAFWATLAASLLAIVFDHFVTDETPDDEEDFRAALDLIALGMARQTHRYTDRHLPDTVIPFPGRGMPRR